jgi:hypothetical protein
MILKINKIYFLHSTVDWFFPVAANSLLCETLTDFLYSCIMYFQFSLTVNSSGLTLALIHFWVTCIYITHATFKFSLLIFPNIKTQVYYIASAGFTYLFSNWNCCSTWTFLTEPCTKVLNAVLSVFLQVLLTIRTTREIAGKNGNQFPK